MKKLFFIAAQAVMAIAILLEPENDGVVNFVLFFGGLAGLGSWIFFFDYDFSEVDWSPKKIMVRQVLDGIIISALVIHGHFFVPIVILIGMIAKEYRKTKELK